MTSCSAPWAWPGYVLFFYVALSALPVLALAARARRTGSRGWSAASAILSALAAAAWWRLNLDPPWLPLPFAVPFVLAGAASVTGTRRARLAAFAGSAVPVMFGIGFAVYLRLTWSPCGD